MKTENQTISWKITFQAVFAVVCVVLFASSCSESIDEPIEPTTGSVQLSDFVGDYQIGSNTCFITNSHTVQISKDPNRADRVLISGLVNSSQEGIYAKMGDYQMLRIPNQEVESGNRSLRLKGNVELTDTGIYATFQVTKAAAPTSCSFDGYEL